MKKGKELPAADELVKEIQEMRKELAAVIALSGLPRYMREETAATYLSLSVGMLRKLRFVGERPEGRSDKLPAVPFVKMGEAVIYDRLDLDVFMESRKQTMSLRVALKKAA